MMVELGCQNTSDGEEELEVGSTYHGKEEDMEGDDDNENDGGDRHKPKESSTPLWKFVTKLGEWKGVGTIKFICRHCHKNYIGSYTCVRKSLLDYAVG
jgi:hypothetical protein